MRIMEGVEETPIKYDQKAVRTFRSGRTVGMSMLDWQSKPASVVDMTPDEARAVAEQLMQLAEDAECIQEGDR